MTDIEYEIDKAYKSGYIKGYHDAIKKEAVEPEWFDSTPFCGNCKHRLEKKNRNANGIKCPACGKLVKWK